MTAGWLRKGWRGTGSLRRRLLSWSLKRGNEPGSVPNRRICKCKGPEVGKSLACSVWEDKGGQCSEHMSHVVSYILREELGLKISKPTLWLASPTDKLWDVATVMQPFKSSFWNGDVILRLPTGLFENSVSYWMWKHLENGEAVFKWELLQWRESLKDVTTGLSFPQRVAIRPQASTTWSLANSCSLQLNEIEMIL